MTLPSKPGPSMPIATASLRLRLAVGLAMLLTIRAWPQQRLPMAIPETSAGANLREDLYDAWPGIATATNSWALSIRQLPQWDQVHHSTLPQSLAMASNGVAVAQLRVGYCYFSGDGLERDYDRACPQLDGG